METNAQYFDCLCRTCMTKVAPSSHAGPTKPQQQWLSIFDIIEECGALRLSEMLSDAVPQIVVHPSDKLPKNICSECWQQLLSFYWFKKMCVQSDKEMHELLSKEQTVLKTPILEEEIKDELETNDADSEPLKDLPCSSTLQNITRHSIQESLPEVAVQTIEPEAAQSSAHHLQDNTQLLEQCIDEQAEFEEFIKNEPIEDDAANSEYSDGDTIHSIISVIKDELIEPEDQQVNDAHLTKHLIHTEDKPYESPHCPLRFNSKTHMASHKTSHEEGKRYECDICGKGYKTRYSFKLHKLIHREEKPHKCDICEKRFTHMQSLETHIRIHTGEKPYKCKYCELGFTAHSLLSNHLRCHLGKNIYRCKLCPLAFPSSAEMRLHLTSHKNEDPETREQNLKALQEEEDKLVLKFSKEKSKGQATDEQQQQKLSNKEIEQQSTDSKGNASRHKTPHEGATKRHECDVCGKKFRMKSYLIRHKRIHTKEKPYKCNLCEKRFTQSQHVKVHIYTHTGEVKPFECSYCPLRFSSKSLMASHKAIHEGIKPHKCSICGKQFVHKSDLKRHTRLHSEEKLHKCHICEKQFTRSQYLTSHIRTHTGDKPYKCKYCERGCASTTLLNYHLRSHLGKNIHRCKFCPLAFPLSAEMRLHLTVHKNEEEEVRERNLKALQEEEAKLVLKFSKEKSKGKATDEQQQQQLSNKKIEQPATGLEELEEFIKN